MAPTVRMSRAVTIQGVMTWEEPVRPGPPGGGGEQPPVDPPGIWGPPGPWPTPPISGIPGLPGYEPPLWPGYPGQPPRPQFPIALPPGGGWMPGFTPGPGYPNYPAHPGPILPPGGGGNPPGIWGPNDPRPQPPIQLPWWILAGLQPPGIWGPPGPWPTPPISGIPGLPGYEPPKPGWPPTLPGGSPVPPAAGVPIEGALVWVPGYGFIFVPKGMLPGGGSGETPSPPEGGWVPPVQPPGPTHPIQPTVPEPKK